MFENESHLMNCSFCSNFQTNRCLQRSYILLYVVFQNPVNHISHNPPQNFTNNYGSHTMTCYIYIYIYIYIHIYYVYYCIYFHYYSFVFTFFRFCLGPASLLKQRLWGRCFPVNFTKFLRTPFLRETSGGCFWRLISDIISVTSRHFYHLCDINRSTSLYKINCCFYKCILFGHIKFYTDIN